MYVLIFQFLFFFCFFKTYIPNIQFFVYSVDYLPYLNRTQLRIITTDRNDFKRALNDVQVTKANYDCPEYAMSGIELALQKSKPNSFFYVFTDASAKDHTKLELIKSLSQKKSIQVKQLIYHLQTRNSNKRNKFIKSN